MPSTTRGRRHDGVTGGMTRATSLPIWVGAAALLAALLAVLITFLRTGGSDAPPGRQAFASSAASSELFERAVAVATPSAVQIQTDTGLGSGVVLDPEGDIVTNAHDVAGASTFV